MELNLPLESIGVATAAAATTATFFTLITIEHGSVVHLLVVADSSGLKVLLTF